MKDLMGGLLLERLASGGLGAGRIAWMTTRRILLRFGGALASVSVSVFTFTLIFVNNERSEAGS